jgi:hypothetical protein
MKKFEPRYRLVRYGMATKVEKASRQQRTLSTSLHRPSQTRIHVTELAMNKGSLVNRQAAQEQDEGVPWYRQDQGWFQEGEEISRCAITMTTRVMVGIELWLLRNWSVWHFFTPADLELQRVSACTAMNA